MYNKNLHELRTLQNKIVRCIADVWNVLVLCIQSVINITYG